VEKTSKVQKIGKRWTKAGTFNSYEDADLKRCKIGENPNVQTRVRRRQAENNFTVHYREILKEEAKKKEKPPKKEKTSKKSRREKEKREKKR
tara:strand:- start:4267 stop:4542 length:276 start_codon:yes stop_codon:yes gene_type:complete